MLVCFVSLMHILWGLLLLVNGGDIHIAATSVLLRIFGEGHSVARAVTYIVSGLLPAVLLKYPGSIFGLLSVAPQQILVILSGISALVAISSGQYADGVVRPSAFIAMDQGVYLLLAMLHALETIDRFNERAKK